mgnify:CR=1 FL=1
MGKSTAFKCGVTDSWVAPITETITGGVSAITYGAPEVFGGTATVAVSPQKGENKVYESDRLVRNVNRIASYKIDVDSRSVAPATEEKYIRGIAAPGTSAASNEEYEEDPLTNTPANCAYGYAHRRTDGKYDAYWYYYTTPSANDISQDSAADAENTPASKYTFDAMPSPETGKIRRRAICANAAALATFFGSVLPATSGYALVSAAAFSVTPPVKAATPQSSHASGTGYTGAIAWSPVAATFAGTTVYTGTVTLTAAVGYQFEPGFAAKDITGLPSGAVVTRVDDTHVTVVVVYPATAA